MKLRRIISLALTLALVLALTGCGSGEKKTTVLRFGLEVAPDTVTCKAAERIAAEVYERTNGSVTIEVYPSGQLGTQRDYIESAMLGIIDIGYTSIAGLESFEPEFILYDIPFTVFSSEHAQALWDSEQSQAVQQELLEEKGLRTMCWLDMGPRNVYTTQEVRTAADFSKLTMRLADVKGLINLFDALHASPQVLAFSDIYTGMQTGVVNGFEIGLASVLASKLEEVVDYCVETSHTYTIDCFFMSEASFQNKLTEEEREIVLDAFKNGGQWQIDTFQENLPVYKQQLADAGVETIVLPEEEMQKLFTMAEPAIEKSIAGIYDISIVDQIRDMAP